MVYPDELLHRVVKPGQYTGGEWNSIIKDWEQAEVRVALVYPDLYEVGMSNLAIPILYDLLNRQPGVLAERVYAPWIDMEAAMRQSSIPFVSLETKHPLKGFDIIGFSLSYELTYTNVINLLDLAGIPPLARERGDSHPLIIAGGGCALNPEPMADFIDLFVVGEGEEITLELIEVFRKWKREGVGKEGLLHALALIPGIYVPRFYEAKYGPDGSVASIVPGVSVASPSIQRRVVAVLPPAVVKPVVPYIEVIHDRGMLEIQRGCSRGCRFCQAGMIYRPQRQRPQGEVVRAVGEMLKNCGYSEISLLSLSTSDYPDIDKLVNALHSRYSAPSFSISLPSLRLDSFSVKLMDSLHAGKKTTLTFAPEAGSDRLRQAINKGICEEEILTTMDAALSRGWTNFKFYFLVGLPTETGEDVEAIPALLRRIRSLGGGAQPRIKVSLATFVPKAHTPFQWAAQASEEQLLHKQVVIRQSLRHLGVQFSWQDPKVSLLEAIMARGDRRLGRVIHRAWQLGCTFDAWSECFDYTKWLKAFDEAGLDPSFYAHRPRPLEEVLPWAHVDVGVTAEFLKREYQRAFSGEETPDCTSGRCNACGLERWHPGCRGNGRN